MIEYSIEKAKQAVKDLRDGIYHDETFNSPAGGYATSDIISSLLEIAEWKPIEGAKTDGTWYELLFEGDDHDPNHFLNGWQIYYGYHSLRAWRTKDHVTGKPKYYRAMTCPPTNQETGSE